MTSKKKRAIIETVNMNKQVSPSGMAAASQAVPGEFDSRHLLQVSIIRTIYKSRVNGSDSLFILKKMDKKKRRKNSVASQNYRLFFIYGDSEGSFTILLGVKNGSIFQGNLGPVDVITNMLFFHVLLLFLL